jgi:GH24 family phage-related lysozyme (muramidase)
VDYNPRDVILGRSPFLREDASNARDKLLIEFIKNQEGFLASAKFDYKQFSIGYGTRARPEEISGAVRITEQEAEKRLIEEVNKFRQEVERFSKEFGYNFNENQKDALTSFIYNLGPGALAQLTKDGTRSIEEISQSLLLYNKANNEVLPGLVQRRELEKALFDTTVPLTNGFQELSNNISRINSLVSGATTRQYASGGFVSGPGSSRSDSIPAMLSNGEYVINAASTKKFLPLLERINSNNLFGFKDGGQLKDRLINVQSGLIESTAGTVNLGNSLENIVVKLDFGKLSTSEVRDYFKILNQIDRQRIKSEQLIAKQSEARLKGNTKEFEELASQIQDSNEAIEDMVTNFYDTVSDKLPLSVQEIRRKINEAIEADAREANKSFTESVRTSFQQLFKGQISFKEFGAQIADSFTGKVVDIFAGRLVDAITGPGVKIFESLFYEVGSLGDGIGTAIKSGGDGLTEGLSGVFKSSGELFTNIFGNIQGLFGSFGTGGVGGSGILGFFSGLGFASGGRVSGPGTGRSDSIPAMLSNGEYVINAESTRKSLPLLEAINNGRISRFAEGGAVGADSSTFGQTTSVNESLSSDQFAMLNNSLVSISNRLNEIAVLVTQSSQGILNTVMATAAPIGIALAIMPFTMLAMIAATVTAPLAGIVSFWGQAILTAVAASSFYGFASGGMISGPGTGRSDSILARVSNGEYIINAAATKRNLPLLEAINSGNMPKFATGGLVDINNTAVSTSTTSKSTVNALSESENKPVQQVFNINITGDISRQTKQEIYQMLPQIANGVNAYNKEKNIRGV